MKQPIVLYARVKSHLFIKEIAIQIVLLDFMMNEIQFVNVSIKSVIYVQKKVWNLIYVKHVIKTIIQRKMI